MIRVEMHSPKPWKFQLNLKHISLRAGPTFTLSPFILRTYYPDFTYHGMSFIIFHLIPVTIVADGGGQAC